MSTIAPSRAAAVALAASALAVFGSPFAATAAKPHALYVMRIDGSQVRKVTRVDDHDVHEAPRWSRDGKRIAFAARNENSRMREVFIVNADGSGLHLIGPGSNPDWSPDDKQLAFDVSGQIQVQTVDGQGQERLGQGRCPRWSPDGSQMALSNDNMLYVLDLTSGEQRALFETAFNTLYPGCAWSPDGKRLALSARPGPRDRRHVMFVNAQGAEQGLTVRLKNEASGRMAFSPDGKQLVFDNAYFVNVVDVEGNASPKVLPGQSAQNLDPDLSPDGQWIVFTSNRD